MSTRANVVIKDTHNELWFYRHSDGYPEGTMPTLKQFLDLVKTGKIRNNVGQAAGWLVLIGHAEYNPKGTSSTLFDDRVMDWKVGAYEPTTGKHFDIEFLYTVDLVAQTITTKQL